MDHADDIFSILIPAPVDLTAVCLTPELLQAGSEGQARRLQLAYGKAGSRIPASHASYPQHL